MAEVDFPCYKSLNDLVQKNGKLICTSCNKRIFNNDGPQTTHCAVDSSSSDWPKSMAAFNRRFLVILFFAFGSSLFSYAGDLPFLGMTDTTKIEKQKEPNLYIEVVDAETGELVPYALITITLSDSSMIKGFSNIDGLCTFYIPTDPHKIVNINVSYIGLLDFRVEGVVIKENKVTRLTIEMEQDDPLPVIGIWVNPEFEMNGEFGKTTLKRNELIRMPRGR